MGEAKHQLKWLLRKIYWSKTRKPNVWMSWMELLLLVEFAALSAVFLSMVTPYQFAGEVDTSSRQLPFYEPECSPWDPNQPGCAPAVFVPTCNQSDSLLLYAPDTPRTASIAETAVRLLSQNDTRCATRGFASADALLAAYLADELLQWQTKAALLLEDYEGGPEYTLAMARPQGEAGRSLQLPALAGAPKVVVSNGTQGLEGGWEDWDGYYAASGFVGLQYAVERALAMAARQPDASALAADFEALAAGLPSVDFAAFPLQPSSSSYRPGSWWLGLILPLYAFAGTYFSVPYLVMSMLLEKEAKLISALRTMGLPLHLYFLSYWIVYGAMYVVGGAIMTVAYALCGFFPNSDLFLLFLTTVFNVPATLAFMSCVVGKCSKQAGQTLAFFGSWVFIGLFILFERTGVPSAAWYPLCIFPMFAGPAGGYRFYELEAAGDGLTWAELTSSGKGPSLLVTWAFQLASAVCWLWWATRLLSAGPAWVKQMPERAAQTDGPAVEESGPPPEGASEAVRLDRLSRAFAAKPKPVVALEALSLSLYEGQITALLGQNGAGKTTTIGILTGLFPQSSGEATVYGHSVRGRGMDAIRRLSGVCPQHDLTFAALSALENLQLAGAVKGLSPAQLADGRLEAMLESVGLEASRHAVRTDNLSGGQKRKLSLACALIGDPKLVLLDEPTAGMDPAS